MADVYIAKGNRAEEFVLVYYKEGDFYYMAGPLCDIEEAVKNIHDDSIRFSEMNLELKSRFGKILKTDLIDIDDMVLKRLERLVLQS